MLTSLQYRLLKWVAPDEPTHMSGIVYASRSKLRVLLGDDIVDRLRDRVVLDFGCGDGNEAVEIAAEGARHVMGVDLRSSALERAARLAASRGVSDRCTFATAPHQPVDVIVSLDSFEHFADPAAILQTMYDMLRPGGQVFISFGPTWYHPYGGHLFSVFPWAHLLFSERALLRWRSDIRSDGATRFAEVEGGLNQMTIRRFERLVRDSPFSLRQIQAVPIRKLRHFHNRVTREFTTAVVRAVLERPAGVSVT
jgi:SAM-dependent methyltransferase